MTKIIFKYLHEIHLCSICWIFKIIEKWNQKVQFTHSTQRIKSG
jgi:hypothetical protein